MKQQMHRHGIKVRSIVLVVLFAVALLSTTAYALTATTASSQRLADGLPLCVANRCPK
jgi:hypothetical protein